MRNVLAARTRANVANSASVRASARGGYKASGIGFDGSYGPGRSELVRSRVAGSQEARAGAAATRNQRTFTRVKRNVGQSRNARTGGFRAANLDAAAIGGPGSRAYIMANIEANRAGNRASKFRNAQGFVGTYGPTRKDLVKMRIGDSAAGRTGGFRRSGVGSSGAVSTAADVAGEAMAGSGRAELNAIQRTGQTTGKKPILSTMKNKKGLMIGAGAAVLAGLAYSGRRGEGSSGGRTSQYRY